MSDPRRAWTWCHAFCQSDLAPTTKHVLHTLHMFMNGCGESCFPSIEEIATYSGLSKRAVLKHLKIAKDAGWVEPKQHGFRGRRWRRQEYVPRWPERDLTASCLPEDDGENPSSGGAPDAPRPENEVVHDVQRGGAPPAPEVVHEGNRVIENNPVTNPSTNPIERERADADAGAPAGAGEEGGKRKTVSRATWRRRLARGHDRWPTRVSSSLPNAEKVFFELSPEDREAALDRQEDYVDHVRNVEKRTIFEAYSTYLSEARWKLLPEKPKTVEPAKPDKAAPYGKAWGAARFADLLRSPYGAMPALTRLQLRTIDQGGSEEAERIRRDRVAKYGWTRVNDMHRHAQERRTESVPPEIAALGDSFVPVRVGEELWRAWRALHAERNWPWFDGERLPDWIYFPAAPEGCEGDVETQVRAAMTRFEQVHETLRPKDAAE